MSKPRLLVIIGSTRPGRVGLPVAEWFADLADKHAGFDVDIADLLEIDLPLMDEPNHPRLGTYVHEHTKEWSARVAAADAVVFVTPEYNHSFSAALKNAIDYLHNEWAYKPAGFVSYGGVAAGTRAVQMLKPIVTALKMVPVNDSVNIPFVAQFLHDGQIVANDVMVNAANAMLDELLKLATALAPLHLREDAAA